MRLLDTDTGLFVWVGDPRTASYAILSHVWDREGEQTYQDLLRLQQSFLPKVRRACQVAREQGYRYIWIDSCCIDKMNIPECSRAISSMYSWYREAAVCYAFLADVGMKDSFVFEFADFRKSKWFTRGWTLQELIAPQVVLFLSADWRALGSKSTLAAVIEDVTGVERTILRKQKALATVSVARRMSWAAKRQTTVLEDRAYSLLGIFDINIPTLYGEGGRAFIRLQQEILKQHPDQSLFVWGK
ncbi:HET-domain-containing protein, partial [Dichomitus squalens LYAD-421 SS1]